jgi:hypothetical protein
MRDEAGGPRRNRRWFLAAGGAVVVGAGAGVGADFLRRRPRPPSPHPPPQAFVDALVTEQRLLASVSVTSRRQPSLAPRLGQLRRDHHAHVATLRAALAPYDRPTRAARRRALAAASPIAETSDALAAAEGDAATRAAERASRLAAADPVLATLFASIAACETTHVHIL